MYACVDVGHAVGVGFCSGGQARSKGSSSSWCETISSVSHHAPVEFLKALWSFTRTAGSEWPCFQETRILALDIFMCTNVHSSVQRMSYYIRGLCQVLKHLHKRCCYLLILQHRASHYSPKRNHSAWIHTASKFTQTSTYNSLSMRMVIDEEWLTSSQAVRGCRAELLVE